MQPHAIMHRLLFSGIACLMLAHPVWGQQTNAKIDKMMKDVQRRLDLSSGPKKGDERNKDIIEALDRMIEELETKEKLERKQANSSKKTDAAKQGFKSPEELRVIEELSKLIAESEKESKADDRKPTSDLAMKAEDAPTKRARDKPIDIQAKRASVDVESYAEQRQQIKAFRRNGQYSRAALLMEAVVKSQRRGKPSKAFADDLMKLGGLYRGLQQSERAVPLYREAVEIKRQHREESPQDYATSISNLGSVLQFLHDYVSAEKLYLEALEWIRHPKTHAFNSSWGEAAILNNLSSLYADQDNYEKAMPLIVRSLLIQPGFRDDLASGLLNLGIGYAAIGEIRLAERHLIPASRMISMDKSGAADQSYAMAILNLAGLDVMQGRWKNALERFDVALRLKRRHIERVLPGLSEKRQLEFTTITFKNTLRAGISLAARFKNDPQVASTSASWIINSKAIVHETVAKRTALARASTNAELANHVDRLSSVRRELSELQLGSRGGSESSSITKEIKRLEETEQRLSKELGEAYWSTLR